MSETLVPQAEIEAVKEKAKQKESVYRGMHNGTVAGKSFEKSRRSRKTHSQRRAQRASTK